LNTLDQNEPSFLNIHLLKTGFIKYEDIKTKTTEEVRNGLGWKHSLGIAFPKDGSTRKGDGPYTEIMHRFELWLHADHGYNPDYNLELELLSNLRKNFFNRFIEEENLFSTQPLKKIKHYGEEVYVCTGCQAQMSPNYLIQCCPSKKQKNISV